MSLYAFVVVVFLMNSLPLPAMVVHADWSKNSNKRWMAKAVLNNDGLYTMEPPDKVGDTQGLLKQLRLAAGDTGCVFVGFDFPIGLPFAFAERCGIDDFLEFLLHCGEGEWQDFFEVANSPQEISLHRPFYPNRPGSARQIHLLNALGMENTDQLRRKCELASENRPAASPLFWTLGGQQVGKATINGWREVLIPALQDMQHSANIKIWPFSAKLSHLLMPQNVVIAETYPAEFYTHLNVDLRLTYQDSQIQESSSKSPKYGKRSQASRMANSDTLLGWVKAHSIHISPDLSCLIQNGFGPRSKSEDEFDALIGVFGMLNIIFGNREPGDPLDPRSSSIEGWILGQQPH